MTVCVFWAGGSKTIGASGEADVQFSKLLSARERFPAGETLFHLLPTRETGIDFQVALPDMVSNVHQLLHLSVMGGICAGDVDGDGLADLYVTSPAGGNRLYLNRGNFKFEDVTAGAGLLDTSFWGTGAVMVDIDGDGDLDLYACGYRSANRLWMNDGVDERGRLRFENKAEDFGLDFDGASMSAAFADYDRDGDLDMYLATTAVPPPPNMKFRVRFEDNRPVIPEELREYWALVYLPGDKAHRTEAGQYDHLFRNDGGIFVDVSEAAAIDGPYFSLGVVWWDVDDDGWPDLYVSNDYLGPDRLYHNQQDGTFREIIRETIPHTPWSSMGMDIGDLNNDGLLDIITTDMLGTTHYRRNVMQGEISRTGWFLDIAEPRQYPRNAILLNTGTSRMLEAAYLTGMAATDWTWAPMIEDFDEDGRVDVYFSNGMLRDVQHADLGNYADKVLKAGSARWATFWAEQPLMTEENRAFRNLGDLSFAEVGEQWGLNRKGVSFGTAMADFDGDGDIDLAVNNVDAPLSLYENRGANGNRIRVRLRGQGSNTYGVGATVRLKEGGREQVRFLTTTRGWLSGSEPILHFGLGTRSNVESLSIRWPRGRLQELKDLSVNRHYEITEPGNATTGSGRLENENHVPPPLFQESGSLSNISDVLSTHDDFLTQPLLPQRLSKSRYCMASGDVDGDGRFDFFLGGGVGQPGRLFLQKSDGAFELHSVEAFVSTELHADTDAAFVDVDGDGDLDLFVVSGGVEIPVENQDLFQSRLYLNDGDGSLTSAGTDVLPPMNSAGSCVAVGDVDGDGRPDLFVGGGPVAGRYPMSGPSRLLRNQGGRFIEDLAMRRLLSRELVTAAEFGDVNLDGKPDLVVATDWGPIRIFLNQDRGFTETTSEAGMAQHGGWWRSLVLSDIDNDGDKDLIAGNLGRNTRYGPTRAEPEVLYLGKLGNDDSELLVEAYHDDGLMYTRRGFDELSRQRVELREKFLNFHEFSLAPLSRIFEQDRLDAATRWEVHTADSVVGLNDGQGRFTLKPLPVEAQISPVNTIAIVDFDADGKWDLVLGQNDFTPDKSTGRHDGGLSVLLRGDGRGGFSAIPSARSGLVIPREVRRVESFDINGDERMDLVFGVPGEVVRAFVRTAN